MTQHWLLNLTEGLRDSFSLRRARVAKFDTYTSARSRWLDIGQVLLAFLWTEVLKNAKKERSQYPATLDSRLVNNMLYAKVKARFGFFYFLPDREITENLFTATENVLRKNTFVHPFESDDTTAMTKARQVCWIYMQQHFDLQHVPCGPPYHSNSWNACASSEQLKNLCCPSGPWTRSQFSGIHEHCNYIKKAGC